MQRLFISLDLDYTHFNTHSDELQWLDSAESWLMFYKELATHAESEGVEIVFGIVTSKNDVDGIVDAAATVFCELLAQHNKHMYKQLQHMQIFYLANLNNELAYICLNSEITLPKKSFPLLFSDDVFSQIEICCVLNKVPLMQRIAAAHGITDPKRMFLFDDNLTVLAFAKDTGIETVSANCFNPNYLERIGMTINNLCNTEYVMSNVLRLRKEIKEKVCAMVQAFKNQPLPAAITLTNESATDSNSEGSSATDISSIDSALDTEDYSPHVQYNLFPPVLSRVNPAEIARPSNPGVPDTDDDEYISQICAVV